MHPRVPFFDELTLLTGSAAEQGYRMPAEWEPQAAVWVSPPHNAATWPGCLPQARAQFADFLQKLAQATPVRDVAELNAPTNDSWIRDYGPIFVKRAAPLPVTPSPVTPGALAPDISGPKGLGVTVPTPQTKALGVDKENSSLQPQASGLKPALALHDFHFNAWGGKYEVRDLDDVIPQHVAQARGVPLFVHDLVLEGGSIDVNGQGTVLTTGQCLLNKNRNPHLKKKQIETALHQALGTHHVIWLPGGILGDDTDGHIDDIARFVGPAAIVGLRAPDGHPDHDILDRNWRVLKRARSHDGCKFDVIEMPVPDPLLYDFPPDRYSSGGRRPVAASYANFLISNRHVFVPVFGQATDDTALRTLEQVLPEYAVIPIRAEHLVVGLGALHCLTQQEPA